MTLWYKPTERPRKETFIIISFNMLRGRRFECGISDYFFTTPQEFVKEWCYLSDLLKAASKAEKIEKKLINLEREYAHQSREYGTLLSDYKHATGKEWEFFEEF